MVTGETPNVPKEKHVDFVKVTKCQAGQPDESCLGEYIFSRKDTIINYNNNYFFVHGPLPEYVKDLVVLFLVCATVHHIQFIGVTTF